MKDVTRDFIVGCVTVIGLVGMAYLLMSFGELDAIFRSQYEVTVRMPQAAGVRVGSTVELNRVPIGKVGDVRVTTDGEALVEVVALINSEQAIPANVEARIEAPLIGGSAVLNLRLPDGVSAEGTLARDGTAAISANPTSLLDDIKSEIDLRLEPFVRSLEKVDTLATTYNELGQDMRSLLAEQSQAELDAGVTPNLRTAIIRLNTTLDDAQHSLALANNWLGDETLRSDIRAAVTQAREVLTETQRTVERYRGLADSLESDADQIVAQFTPVADQIAATLEEVRLVSRRALEGPGTVAQLLNNPTLYLSLNDAATRLERALADIQLLIQQVRAEGLKVDL